MKVAIVYDRVNKWGGAERVLLVLHEMFPNAPLFTSVYSPQNASWANVFPKIETSFLQKFPLLHTRHERIPFLMPLAFESFDFKKYELVISVTSEAAKGILTHGNTKHICYCLTPTRYLWSGYKTYFPSKFKRKLYKPALGYLKKWDLVAATRPDYLIGISKAVQKRIKKYYNRDSHLIYPPVDIRASSDVKKPTKLVKKNYFLLVSRLVPYKRVDLAVEAFNQLKWPLIVVGEGSEEQKLRARANRNITFISKLTDQKLSQYYGNAKALIFPQEEDFGLTAVEAQALGTPVIAFKKGGASELVHENETGILFDKQTPEALKYVLQQFSQTKFDQKKMIKNAKRFSKEKFQRNFLNYINKVI